MAEPLLALKNVRAGYGDAVVLDDVSLEIAQNGSLALLGRNGVGKSTLLLTIMGFTRVGRGSIEWQGKNITALAPHLRARSGLGWVAQEREIFANLPVEENLTVAARPGRWDLGAIFGLFPRIAERRGNKGNQLPAASSRCSRSRALMTNPALLLLDEPRGLSPYHRRELTAAIARMMKEQGTALILVEQHAEIALHSRSTPWCSSAAPSFAPSRDLL